MPANVAEKEAVVKDIQDKFSKAKSVVFVDYRGLTVAEVTELRNRYRAAGVDYKVLKNTMITRAIDGNDELSGLKEHLAGPTAVAFGYEDAIAAPKVTYDFMKEVDNKISVKVGVMEGAVAQESDLKAIASLPSREVLLAKAIGSINAPIANFVYAINAIKTAKEQEEA